MTEQKPTHPCRCCGENAWYWPGDYFWGKKRWLCGKCFPAPADNIPEKETTKKELVKLNA